MRVLRKTAHFNELFAGHAIRVEKVRGKKGEVDNHTWSPSYIFSAGKYLTNPQDGAFEWRALWVKPRDAVLEEVVDDLCNGVLASLRLIRGIDGKIRAVANDNLFIGSVVVAEEVVGLPSEVLALV